MADHTSVIDQLAAGRAEIRKIGLDDIRAALREGWADFMARPSAIVFLFVVYPVVGFVLSYIAFDYALLPLIVPLMAGFALLAPISAVGIYEMSRRREAGEEPKLVQISAVRHRPGFHAILTVAGLLLLLFVAWVTMAQQIVYLTIGSEAPAGIGAFLSMVFSTGEGMSMFIIGNLVGFFFALAAAMISVFSLPMLVDGETSAGVAIGTSLRACLDNPVTMAAWGLTVAVILFASMVPFFAGLVIALPVLAHATWHLYRRTITRE